MEFSQILGNLHLRLVPFPVVLLLAALLLDLAGLIWRHEKSHWAGKLLMMAGTVTLLLAFIAGISAEIWAGRAGVPLDAIEQHEVAATIASWGFIALMAWRLFLTGTNRRAMTGYIVVGLALYALLALTGWLGGKLVTSYGAAVTGADAKTVTSLHDLNVLAQRQTDWNLRYSDIMHRAAGGFALVLTLTIFVRELWPHHAGKTRWVGPALLIAGGVLLFIFADLDLYALTDLRQFLDREAQAHKLIAIILAGVGVRMLFKPGHVPTQYQNRLVAVLALVGGAILFTHIHSVAPYANVAAGVYINHIVMGFVALAIGGVKLAGDVWSAAARRRLAFPVLLLVECFLLLTYTEGIPWWAGIGHYHRWGPNGGTIAPFGRDRAELTLDEKTGEMNLRVLARFEHTPVSIPASNVTVVVAQGYRETAVPLALVDTGHYRGDAGFLRGALAFDARVTLPGRRTGWFDPWVTSAIAGIPPNKVAKFVCPMHEGIRSVEPGDCRLCAMPLVPVQLAPRTGLHDAKYAMKFERAGDTLRFTPQLAATGQTVRDLAVVHEYRLHLIIISADLAFFDHVHPARQDDGSFALDYKFPGNGNFLLFADLTPEGDRSQVFRIEVGRDRRARHGGLGEAALPTAREIAGYHVELIPQPRTLVEGRHAHLSFRLERNGQPVTDLQPYIGAMGHCVIISEDTQRYLHSHPTQLTAPPSPATRGGPVVSFHTTFPAPGRYKVWGQFKPSPRLAERPLSSAANVEGLGRQHGDEIIVADFVVNVERSWLPAWFVQTFLTD